MSLGSDAPKRSALSLAYQRTNNSLLERECLDAKTTYRAWKPLGYRASSELFATKQMPKVLHTTSPLC